MFIGIETHTNSKNIKKKLFEGKNMPTLLENRLLKVNISITNAVSLTRNGNKPSITGNVYPAMQGWSTVRRNLTNLASVTLQINYFFSVCHESGQSRTKIYSLKFINSVTFNKCS